LFQVPEPHPLDYDWRFENATVQALGAMIPRLGRMLIVGAPSVARFLQTLDRDMILVDRQPLQGIANHLVREAATFDLPNEPFAAAIIDPPWYPDKWRLWTTWVARAIGLGRDLFVSLWPSEARPNALLEINEIGAWLSDWAEIEWLGVSARYETPIFEQAAISASKDGMLAISPRVGRLLRLRVRRLPPPAQPSEPASTRLRFVIDDYQLGLRLGPGLGGSSSIRALTNKEKWIWPFVSERAPERGLIDLWSSRNEVASVGSPRGLAAAIRTALKKGDRKKDFERALMDFPELLEWQIPRPPHRRILEWHHRQ
jgi:hypothetical protein